MDGENNTNKTTPTQTGISQREAEIIQQLVKEKLSQQQELAYEDLDGYEVPPRTQFSMLNKPAVSIKADTLVFNTAAVRLFEGIKYIVPILHTKKKRLTCIICSEEESASVQWARCDSKGKWVNRDVKSADFVQDIYGAAGWQPECRYKVLAELRNSQRGLVLVFDLQEAIMFTPDKEEYIDRKTGEVKKRQRKYYPDFYKDRTGRYFNDYEQARQLNMFEDIASYDTTTQNAGQDNGQNGGSL